MAMTRDATAKARTALALHPIYRHAGAKRLEDIP